MPPAQAHRPVAHRQHQQLEQDRAPNPNGRRTPEPSARSGMAQIPKVRLQPTSNPKEQRTPSVHCDTAPNPQRHRSESRRARTLDRRATGRGHRDLRSRSHPAKHSATIRTCLHAGHVPQPIPQSYRAERVAARHSSLDPFRRKCIAGPAQHCKPGHQQSLQPRHLPRTPCCYCHPRLHQRDICLDVELKKPGSEYQSHSFRSPPDAVPAGTQNLAPPESEPLHPSNSGMKPPSPMRGEAQRLLNVARPASLGPPTTDLLWLADDSDWLQATPILQRAETKQTPQRNSIAPLCSEDQRPAPTQCPAQQEAMRRRTV